MALTVATTPLRTMSRAGKEQPLSGAPCSWKAGVLAQLVVLAPSFAQVDVDRLIGDGGDADGSVAGFVAQLVDGFA